MSYVSELVNKQYTGNVIIRFLSTYFSIRQPDSGLTVDTQYNGLVSGLQLSSIKIDPKIVQTPIANYTFKLLDKDNVITALVKDLGQDIFGENVEIWVGRTGVSMAFADYFKLPITKIKKIEHSENAYSFSSAEETDRIAKPIYDAKTRLSINILSGTTIITGLDDTTDFPSAGRIKIEDEFFDYTSKNDGTKTFSGITRAVNGSTAVAHDANVDMILAETITDNPLNIILKLLISGGGGGAYDVLDDGLGISNTLIDVSAIEDLRDDKFPDIEFELTFYDIEDALKYIEQQLLAPCGLRFSYGSGSTLSLVQIDQPIFVDPVDRIDEDTITSYPKWMVDDNKIVNEIIINWDFNEGTQEFNQRDVYTDATSQSDYGRRTPLTFNFKGVQEDLEGQDFLDTFAQDLLYRLANPKVEIDFSGQIDKHLINPGEITILESSQVPRYDGTLGFDTEVEVLSRGIDHIKGQVNWKLGFTAFSTIRSGYIGPSDLVAVVNSQSSINMASGRTSRWDVGYKVRLWDDSTDSYEADAVNTVATISGDTMTFQNAWSTTLTTDHRIKFADYDQGVTDEQFRYCFISDDGNDFGDGERTYSITK